jgi:hypothetical protein
MFEKINKSKKMFESIIEYNSSHIVALERNLDFLEILSLSDN